ncbi:MAG TPA: PAS domain S-box protein [bacterium]|nr:PAS domain S-box protein [bacterium]
MKKIPRVDDAIGANQRAGRPLSQNAAIEVSRTPEPPDAYRTLFENLPIGVYRSSVSGLLLDVNPALIQLSGYGDRETLLRVPVKDILTGAGHRRQLLEALRHTGCIRDFETSFRRADGSMLSVLVSVFAQHDPDGQVRCLEGIVVDVTSQRRRDERISVQAAALNAAADGIVITDSKGAIEWVNPAFTRLTGYALEDVVGRNPRLLKSGRHDAAFYTTLWTTIQSRQVWHGETTNRRKDGTFYTEEQTIAPVIDRAGEITHFVAIKHDITRRKDAEATQRRLIAILEATPDFVGTASVDGKPTYLNRGGQRLLGVEGIANETILDAYPERLREFIRHEAVPAAIRDGQWRGEMTLLRRDGREVAVSQIIIAHTAPDGTVEFLSTVMRDITERKQAEEQLHRQVERLAALRDIDIAITSSTDLRVTLEIVLDKIIAQLEVSAVDVLLLNQHTQTLNYAAGRGFRTGALEQTRLWLGQGHAGRAAIDHRPVIVPDLLETPLVRASLIAGEGFMSYVAVPLIAKGMARGVLECFLRVPKTFDAAWLDLLETFAGQAAIAVDNATLLSDLTRSNTDLTLAYDVTLEGWSRALDLRNGDIGGHSQRVTDFTLRMARALGIEPSEFGHIRRGSLLHDIGELGVPDAILLKQGPLTEGEWQIVRRHPVSAYELLQPIPYLRQAIDIPHCHHERWDGTGYPRGLRGEQIPLAARIFAVADTWDVLNSNRPYRAAWNRERAVQHIRGEAGRAFDPKIVEMFLQLEQAGDLDVESNRDCANTHTARST